jgi:hypothetical protein
VLEFPLTEVFENRDYSGSTHFFFDLGAGNTIAFNNQVRNALQIGQQTPEPAH